MTTRPAHAAPSPGPVPTLQDRAGQLVALGWTGREAEWLALVALHSGVFTRSQWRYFFNDARPEQARRFVHALIDKKLASEDARAIFPGNARAVLLTGKAPYRALGIPDVRHRRAKDATTQVLMRRLLSLDYLIERPSLGWLPTETDKVQRFEALGIDRGTFPYRMYGPEGKPQIPRYFAFKLPIAVDEHMATADSSYVPEGFDPRLAELVDHLAVDLAHVFLGVPQPGVSGTVVPPPGPPQGF